MGKRTRSRAGTWVTVGVLSVVALLAVVFWGSRASRSVPASTPSTPPTASGMPGPRRPVMTTAPQPAGSSRITGRVRDARGWVAGARVSASRPEPWRTLSELPCPTTVEGQEKLPVGLRDCGIEYRRMLLELVGARLGEAPVFAEVTTDAEGRFVLEGLPEGSVTLWALAETGAGVQPHVPVGREGVELQMEEGRVVEGNVTALDGTTPIADARVTVIDREHTRFFSTVADAQGTFQLGPLPLGRYSVSISAEGWAPRFIQDLDQEGPLEPVTLARASRLAGRVVAVDGSPAAGLLVLLDGDTALATEQVTTTDGAGRFTFDDVPELPHQLNVGTVQLGAFATLTVTPPAQDVVLQLQPGVYVDGTVSDDTGRPIAGAKVSTFREDGGPVSAEATTVTSASGRYRLGPVRAGPHTFKLEAAHHLDMEVENQSLDRGQGPLDFTLDRAASAEGTVVDAEGQPLAGISLGLHYCGDRGRGCPPDDVTLTDADGHFVLDAPQADSYWIIAEGDAFIPSAHQVQAPSTSLRLVMSRGASVSGHVTDAQGLPVRHASIRLVREEEEADEGDDTEGAGTRYGETEGPGTFLLQGLRPGRYVLEATVSREWMNERVSQPIELQEREQLDVPLRLEEGRTLSGVVVDGTGQPLADVLISAKTPEDDDAWNQFDEGIGSVPALAGIRSGPDGRFILRHLTAPRYSLDAYLQDHIFREERSQGGTFDAEEQRFWVEAQAEQVRLVLVRYDHLKGRLVDPDGKAITTFRAIGDSNFQAMEPETQDDGTFTIPVTGSGTHALTLKAPGFAPLHQTATWEEGVDVELGTLTLPRPWTLRLHLRDEETGAPVTQTKGLYAQLQEPVMGGTVRFRAVPEQPVFRDGVHELPTLPPLPFTLDLSVEGFLPISIEVRTQEPLTVSLNPAARVRLSARDANGKPVPAHFFLAPQDRRHQSYEATAPAGTAQLRGVVAGEYLLRTRKLGGHSGSTFPARTVRIPERGEVDLTAEASVAQP
ncbi:carboxypeptidase-like regulatory domain-containing protein [Corallococcus sp. bb12-1]|uniref:carboxypeptidase-like regulatory domain-containing protein n=1 Tax=Corallococcus sp. bb12-1 TaxID=2996784 RepID=UPI00226F412F|nr:carboxypeptidase-like regulatory domain-containing protein [Corallococcus sp. bb12-1]MCY1043827.1 carboxypeptidase-like regulatory domain-containing protein [Corallococcus sp. bb12-1]